MQSDTCEPSRDCYLWKWRYNWDTINPSISKQWDGWRQSHPKGAYDIDDYITFKDYSYANIAKDNSYTESPNFFTWDNNVPFKVSFITWCRDYFGKTLTKEFTIEVKCKPNSKTFIGPP